MTTDKINKTTAYLLVLHHIAESPNRRLSEQRLKDILGINESAKSMQTWYRQIKELKNGFGLVPGVLLEYKDQETGELSYAVNHSAWQSFIDAHTEGKFLLECYRKVGFLLDSDFANMIFDVPDMNKRDVESISRKFFHLVKIQALRTPHSKKVLDAIITALIGNHELKITYDGGVRRIQPLTLCQYRDDLYIMCKRFSDELQKWEERTFKLSRITKIEETGESFIYPRPGAWDPVQKYKDSSGLILGEVKHVLIRVYGHSRKILKEKFFFNGDLTDTDKESDTYSCSYTNVSEFLGQMFTYAEDIEILDDENLRNALIEKAEATLKRNQRSSKKVS